jgi:hypothetical protein
MRSIKGKYRKDSCNSTKNNKKEKPEEREPAPRQTGSNKK